MRSGSVAEWKTTSESATVAGLQSAPRRSERCRSAARGRASGAASSFCRALAVALCRLRRCLLLGAQLCALELDLVAVLVVGDEAVLVAEALLAPAALLSCRHLPSVDQQACGGHQAFPQRGTSLRPRRPSRSALEESQLEHARAVEAVDPSEPRAAAATAAPAGSSPTSSEPATRAPSRRRRAAIRATPRAGGEACQSSTFIETCTRPALRQLEPERAHAGEAAAPLANGRRRSPARPRAGPRRLTLKAISGRRAPTITPPAAGSSRAGPKSGTSSPASSRRCSSSVLRGGRRPARARAARR